MAKNLRRLSGPELQDSRAALLKQLQVPPDALCASYVRQFLTCGKPNCRCRRGHKHGPYYYLVQCQKGGGLRKFLLKTPEQRQRARTSIAAHAEFQKRLDQLSQVNAELLRRAGRPTP